MAFYLKKTKLKGRTYLSIDESFYDNERKGTAHRAYKSMTSYETLKAQGIEDPIAYCQKEVDRLNALHKMDKVKEISVTPERYLGYFLFKSLLDKMQIKKYIDYYKLTTSFRFDLYDVLSSLVYSRVLNPCSKHRTFTDVIPRIFEEFKLSYDQLMEGLSFLGNNYEQMIELFFTKTKECFDIKTDACYFDCTNFYFEIDREDDWKRKGPSKENRKEPIIGMGLLLDGNQIPIGMKLYPGNQSEKPVLRGIIKELKEKSKIEGRTVQVADKGLNCAENIFSAISSGDGYLFSKSVKTLSDMEKGWLLNDEDKWTDVKDSDGNILYSYKSVVDVFDYEFIPSTGKKKKFNLTEKRVVTFNPSLARKQKLEIEKMVSKARELNFSKAKKAEFGEAAKYVNFKSVDKDGVIDDDNRVVTDMNEKKIQHDLALCGYNMLVTSEIKLTEKEIYQTYHNLWRIEESFRIMKSDLDARPVYCQTIEAIKGHFLICYISVLLERILEFNIFKGEFSSSQLIDFMRKLKIAKVDKGYLNLTSMSDTIKKVKELTNLPLTNYHLTETEIKRILKYKV